MFDWLGDLLGGLFEWLVELLINFIVVPIIEAVILLVKYFFAYIFYLVSTFMLNLIDFAELLFRCLAGLDNTKAASGDDIFISLNGQEGDLLIQFIRHPDVVKAFYACAIVGIFLLIIMTIFKMIQVEYTTEGAKNSKGPIIGKSLKALANMLLIPLLSIFGIFIGNQILDLIDTATAGQSGDTIAGTLFVTAATEAYSPGDGKGYTEKDFANEDERISKIINLAIDKTIFATGLFASDEDKESASVTVDMSGREAVERLFRSKGNDGKYREDYYYGDLFDVIQHYDFFEINYIVLIFGAVIIIKCLYFTCFGLIDRIYQCVALFVVSPMVIGMAPVKDNMGSWRSKFMSKALSAYGTVIAINMFFIIIKVVLQLDFAVNVGMWFLTDHLLAGLLKCIFVIVGTMMIEKLTGDIGGYFGAGNAMADGKAIAGEAMAGVAKVATVAGGGAMLAGKVGMGIANKVTGGVAGAKLDNFKKKVNNSSFVQGAKDIFSGVTTGRERREDKAADAQLHKAEEDYRRAVASGERSRIADAQDSLEKAKRNKEQTSKELSDKMAERESHKIKKKYSKSTDEASKKFYEADDRIDEADKILNDKNASEDDKFVAAAQKELAEKDKEEASKQMKKNQDAIDKELEEQATKKRINKEKRAVARESVLQMAENKFGGSAIWKTIAPKSVAGIPVASLPDEFKKAGETAMGASDEGKAMLADIKNYESGAKSDALDKRNSGLIDQRKAEAAQILANGLLGQIAISEKQTNDQMEKLAKLFEEAMAKSQDKNQSEGMREMYQQDAIRYSQQMTQLNSNVKIDANGHIDMSTIKVEYDTADLKKEIEAAIKKGAKMDELNGIIEAQLKKMGLEGNDKLLKQIAKMVEELKGAVGK